MHESFKRLLDAARSKHSKRKVEEIRDLADELSASSAVITNWKSRGVSKIGAFKAEEILGISAQWVLTGSGKPFPDTHDYAPPIHGVSESDFLYGITVSSRVRELTWEDAMLKIDSLTENFAAPMPDGAMEPKVPAGTLLEFRPGGDPTPGHGVLLQDLHGNLHVRRYQTGANNRWNAIANNDSYASFTSSDDVKIVASVVAIKSGSM